MNKRKRFLIFVISIIGCIVSIFLIENYNSQFIILGIISAIFAGDSLGWLMTK